MASNDDTVVDWYVSLEQRVPYESHVLEIFSEEADALRYASAYMAGRPGHQTSRRRWTLIQADGPSWYLIVWKREG